MNGMFSATNTPTFPPPSTFPTDMLPPLDDSDEEKDAGPSFYYKPNLDHSPDKLTEMEFPPTSPPQPHIGSSPHVEATTATRPLRPHGPFAPLTRSTSLVEQSRGARPVSRVPSTSAIFRRDRGSDAVGGSPLATRYDAGESARLDSIVDPETPAAPSYNHRRPLSTTARSSSSTHRDVPSITPGLSRFSSRTAVSATTSKIVPLRRTGSSSPTSAPESDNSPFATQREASPEFPSLSPRVSPNGTQMSSSVATRPRLMSGRLGTTATSAPAQRARKLGLMSGANAIVESDEEKPELEYPTDRHREDNAEREARRLSLQRQMQRDAEDRLRELEHDSEMEADVDRELQREKELMEQEVETERMKDKARLERFPGDVNRKSLDRELEAEGRMVEDRADVSPTQRDYDYLTPSSNSVVGRARAASSSEYSQATNRIPAPPGDIPQHQRAATSLDHYPPQSRMGLSAPKSIGRPVRPGQSHPAPISKGEPAEPPRPRSRGSRQNPEPPSSTRHPSAPLVRQGSNTIVPATASVATGSIRHKRNPSASSPPTLDARPRSGLITDMENPAKENRAHWAGPSADGDGRLKETTNYDRESEMGKDGDVGVTSKQHASQTPATTPHSQPPVDPPQVTTARKPNPTITVHRKIYQRLECIGRGGSSRVYRVVSPDNAIYAIKRVSLENADQATIESYKNEIALLRRLEGNKRIIRLIEFDSTSSKKNLLMVMECGEVDLAKLLSEKQGEPVDFPWVTSYWHQMLQAVQVIHEEKIVHSDLKPANFVLVKGSLKLIDFGIAKAIPNDTTNIQRDQQIGTVNYMSPEAIQGTHGMTGVRVMKLGRASDVWSLGCILYQMIYGQPPFYFLTMWQKMTAIPDPNHTIEFSDVAVPTILGPRDPQTGQAGPPQRLVEHSTPIPPGIIGTMRNCLQRDPKKRPSIPELLGEKWNMNPVQGKGQVYRPSSPTPLLRPDEAIIDDNMMFQLIHYTLTNVPRDASPAQIKEMVKGEGDGFPLIEYDVNVIVSELRNALKVWEMVVGEDDDDEWRADDMSGTSCAINGDILRQPDGVLDKQSTNKLDTGRRWSEID
ncbi:Dual-specificity kinase, spindle pole body (SPB) duplication and spindle checkpoint function [Tulasnella sp. 403]|nr:Dual-specificity kinase, spindle pole body (SPB) duplication and spindle checkpoint function [Tulasnella sp. 403]